MYFNLIIDYFDLLCTKSFTLFSLYDTMLYMSKNNVVTSDSATNKGPAQGPGFKGSKKGGKNKGNNNTKRVNRPQKKG